MTNINIKEWKMRQIAEEQHGGFLEDIIAIERETEKACLIKLKWGHASSLIYDIKVWVPKSAILSDEEYAAEIQKKEENFKNACQRYENMIAFAKKAGLKVRKGMKKETVLYKIAEAGLEYEY